MDLKKLGYILVLIAIASFPAEAQKFLIRFTDKGHNSFSLSNPSSFLSQRSIDRRNRYAIALDSTDLPVTPAYIDSIRSVPGVTVLNASKWLNQVSVQVSDNDAINRIALFPFVINTSPIASKKTRKEHNSIALTGKIIAKRKPARAEKVVKVFTNYFDYGNTYSQIHLHNGEFLHNIGLRGQNMVIGMLDAGYQNYTTLKAFDSVNANQQILGTWDFVSNHATVVEDNAHGMQCFSIIAGNIPGMYIGSAPKANFYLYRTENTTTEFPIEEHDWVCGAERLDSSGGDVISSSLGYFNFDNPQLSHTYADMNGNVTIAARGADLAAKKGILVVNSIGNEGNKSWKYLLTPSDGDSVLAVGAVNKSGQSAPLSGYGPSSDGQVKPDVAAVGVATWVQYPNNTLGTGNGTSFACPIIAGLATCLWQGFQEDNNMAIINALRQAGSIASNPDDRIGYGIPDVRKALGILLKKHATVSASFANCQTTLKWTSKDVSAMKYEIERKMPGETDFTKIAEYQGTSSEFSAHAYEVKDIVAKAEVGAISYRIKQVIDTGATSFFADYLDTVTIDIQSSCASHEQINVFPNPSPSGKFSVQIVIEEPIDNLQIVVFNGVGQKAFFRKETKPAGTITYVYDVPQLASGRYFVSVFKDNEKIDTKELVIAR